MADFTTEFRMTTVEYLRRVIGDEDRLIYSTDEELDSYLRGAVNPINRSERINAIQGSYYSFAPCPVLDLQITDGTVAGVKYRIDEHTKFIKVVAGTQPADNTSIEIRYITINFNRALTNVLKDMATDRAKLALISKTGDIELNMEDLADSIMKQAQRLEVWDYWKS